jgi:hypothetical protein
MKYRSFEGRRSRKIKCMDSHDRTWGKGHFKDLLRKRTNRNT